MSKHRLVLDDSYDFLAFGISCHLKDYRAAWYLNKALHKDFIRQTVNLPVKGGKFDAFPLFSCKDPDRHVRYMLLDNQNEEVYLMPNLKQYDFFLFVEGYIEVFHEDAFTEQLRHIEPFQLVRSLDTEVFNHIQYALFED